MQNTLNRSFGSTVEESIRSYVLAISRCTTPGLRIEGSQSDVGMFAAARPSSGLTMDSIRRSTVALGSTTRRCLHALGEPLRRADPGSQRGPVARVARGTIRDQQAELLRLFARGSSEGFDLARAEGFGYGRGSEGSRGREGEAGSGQGVLGVCCKRDGDGAGLDR
jgi:hypothetical protein